MERSIFGARRQIAFYASTPAYRPAFELHGYGDLADELAHLSRAQKWDELPGRVDDEMLHTYAVVGTYDEVAGLMGKRFAGVADATELSIPVRNSEDEARLAEMVSVLQAV